ncbi:GNAT family N-acetyltransferase [Aerophototrophica crusticola]|uniref:GNAT family N-acetyltransferase n=1 Tax=Aerophototrophica crusticola TaxID=1709002 RepID=A0A858R858_9PROT|nr:GNAT family N-acetyltransferase [Rhodospirillaceae bacterium B3]
MPEETFEFENLPFDPARHGAAVERIAGEALGEGYFTDLAAIAARDGVMFLVATGPEGVVGFAYAWMVPRGRLAVELPRLAEAGFPDDVRALDGEGRVAIVQTIAVSSAMRGRGIASRLFGAVEGRLAGLGAGVFLVPAWCDGTRTNLEGVLVKGGYRHLADIGAYWKEGCDAGAFRCPARGEVCRCGVRFFLKRSPILLFGSQ